MAVDCHGSTVRREGDMAAELATVLDRASVRLECTLLYPRPAAFGKDPRVPESCVVPGSAHQKGRTIFRNRDTRSEGCASRVFGAMLIFFDEFAQQPESARVPTKYPRYA